MRNLPILLRCGLGRSFGGPAEALREGGSLT
jgi:hypothetical protein